MNEIKQRILVFQQSGSARSKIAGIMDHGRGRFQIEIVSIDQALPPILDNGREFLPSGLEADLVLDFLKHPDLSLDLAELCAELGLPVVASGKKIRTAGVITPPT